MEIPSIKLNTEKTKIENLDLLKSFINSYNNIEELKIYYDKLKEKEKVQPYILQELISIVEMRLHKLDDFYNSYINVSENDNTLYQDNVRDFFEINIHMIISLKNSIEANSYLSESMFYIIKEFLEFVIETEEFGLINNSDISKLFDDFSNIIKLKIKENIFKNDKEKELYYDLNVILDKKDNIINKKQEDDYFDDNYLSRTQVLKFSPSNNVGHKLTEDDNFKYGGYIVTTIVLEASLALALIILLILLFK